MSDLKDKVDETLNPSKEGHLSDEDINQAKVDMTRTEQLRSDSGNVEFSDTLTTFFYLLLRDHLPAGKVEMIIHEVITGADTVLFTNGFLAQYADNLATALKNTKVNTLAKALESAFEGDVSEDAKEKKSTVSHFGGDPDELQTLKNKVDEAIENMSKEEKEEWDDRVERALDEVEEGVSLDESLDTEDDEPPQVQEKESVDEENDRKEYRTSIAQSLNALEDLKALVPTEGIAQIVEILKHEVGSELSDSARADIQSRESILQRQADVNAEHKSKDVGAEEEAIEYVKDQVEEAMLTGESKKDSQDEKLVSRGNLKDVKDGKAFPEALDKVFEDNDPEGELKQAKELKEVMSTFRKHPGLFQRVE